MLIVLARGVAQTAAHPRSVAITIDDGPAVNEMKDLGNFQRIAQGPAQFARSGEGAGHDLLHQRAAANVPGQRDGRAAVLAMWLDAGYDLANHTYSHSSANKATLREFEDDIVRGDVMMRPMMEERGRKLVWFRYPYLDSGMTQQAHQSIMDFLEERHYRVARVTVDYKDYSFAGVYSGCCARAMRLPPSA